MPAIDDHLGRTVARVDLGAQFSGTAFFIAPGLLLTCAHVTQLNGKLYDEVLLRWEGRNIPADVVWREPDLAATDDKISFWPYPDLCLLKLKPEADASPIDHPCAAFDLSEPRFLPEADQIYAYGFSKGAHMEGAIAATPVKLELVGNFEENNEIYLKAKGGEVLDGMSGGPALNIRTSGICGLIESKRKVGGFAIPFFAVRARLERLMSASNHIFRQVGGLWSLERATSPRMPKVTALQLPFLAVPEYVARNEFVGRDEQLNLISAWAKPDDSNPIMLFEAIGGMGKSMLTWKWVNDASADVRSDWAGRFWYSFYEEGASMKEFCVNVLAYMTQSAASDFRRYPRKEQNRLLMENLRQRPWLLILDGLERILVAYHRADCVSLADDKVEELKDDVATRDRCDAIDEEDAKLLELLTTAKPSKILVTSRLTPKCLVNDGDIPILGVNRPPLGGLEPAHAETLLRSLRIKGSSNNIRDYLQRNCGCHPLVTRIIAGQVNKYKPNRGDFDAWSIDPQKGGHLDLGSLSIVQKRNHILRSAIEDLSENSQLVLSVLALLSSSVTYPILLELYSSIVHATGVHHAFSAEANLEKALEEIDQAGLVQYDDVQKTYDLHPVVRGVASGRLEPNEEERAGQTVIDIMSRKPQKPFRNAEKLADLEIQLEIIRVFLRLGRMQKAADAYIGKICNVLEFKLEAHPTVLSLLRPFFRSGWGQIPDCVDLSSALHLSGHASTALRHFSFFSAAKALALVCIKRIIAEGQGDLFSHVTEYSNNLRSESRIAPVVELMRLSYAIEREHSLRALNLATILTTIGRYDEAIKLIPIAKEYSYSIPDHLRGRAEILEVKIKFFTGKLKGDELENVRTSITDANRSLVSSYLVLCGEYHLEQRNYEIAREKFSEAITKQREIGEDLPKAVALYSIAELRMNGNIADIRRKANELPQESLYTARLWFELGDNERAGNSALHAYSTFWADGEPYVSRRELEETRDLLESIGVAIPVLPPYDPAKETETELSELLKAYAARIAKERSR